MGSIRHLRHAPALQRALSTTVTRVATGATIDALGVPRLARDAWRGLPADARSDLVEQHLGAVSDQGLAVLAVGALVLVWLCRDRKGG